MAIDYFQVLTHGELPSTVVDPDTIPLGEALYAPEGADDKFWSRVLEALNDPTALFSRFYG